MSNGRETQTAVEQLLLKKNGEKKTVADVFELVIAVHHDAQAEQRAMLEKLERHLEDAEEYARAIADLQQWREDAVTSCPERVLNIVRDEHAKRHAAFEASHEEKFVHMTPSDMAARMRDREHILEQVKALTERAPRRASDPPDVDYRYPEDTEIGDMRRAWRVLRWVIAVAAVPLLVALGNELTKAIFG